MDDVGRTGDESTGRDIGVGPAADRERGGNAAATHDDVDIGSWAPGGQEPSAHGDVVAGRQCVEQSAGHLVDSRGRPDQRRDVEGDPEPGHGT